MKCENCRAWNAHVIHIEDERWILCPRCLSILKNLNDEYQNIVGVDDIYAEELTEEEIDYLASHKAPPTLPPKELPVCNTDEVFSSGHIVDEHAEISIKSTL